MSKDGAILYARLSNSRDDNEPTIDEQIREGLAFIAAQGWSCDPKRMSTARTRACIPVTPSADDRR